jgi:hypothetical protein
MIKSAIEPSFGNSSPGSFLPSGCYSYATRLISLRLDVHGASAILWLASSHLTRLFHYILSNGYYV